MTDVFVEQPLALPGSAKYIRQYIFGSYYFQSIGPLGRCFLKVNLFICLSVCLSVCSLLRYRLNVFLLLLPEVRRQIFLEIRHPWGKVMKRNGFRIKKKILIQGVKSWRAKKFFFGELGLINL